MTFAGWIMAIFPFFSRHPPSPVPAPRPDPAPEPLAALFDAVNAAREANARPRLSSMGRLDMVAMARAGRMDATGILTHLGFEGEMKAKFPGRANGECLAQGQPTAEEVVREWMGHPPHRVIVLGDFAYLGCGHSGGYWAGAFLGA